MQGIRRFALDAQRPYHALNNTLNQDLPPTAHTCSKRCTPQPVPPVSEKTNRAALRAKSAIMCSRSMVDTVLTFSSSEPLQVSCVGGESQNVEFPSNCWLKYVLEAKEQLLKRAIVTYILLRSIEVCLPTRPNKTNKCYHEYVWANCNDPEVVIPQSKCFYPRNQGNLFTSPQISRRSKLVDCLTFTSLIDGMATCLVYKTNQQNIHKCFLGYLARQRAWTNFKHFCNLGNLESQVFFCKKWGANLQVKHPESGSPL